MPTRPPPLHARRRSFGQFGQFEQHPLAEPSHHCIDDIKHIVDDLTLAEDDLALLEKQQSFVRSLHVEGQSARHESIPEALHATLEWVLPAEDMDDEAGHKRRGDEGLTPRVALSRWLQHGSGIFWVSGRPGAGKSTLMKFISDHARTRAALEKWADGKPLTVAAHYFWISGTGLQKSLKGMLMRLLFDVLQHQPALAPAVFGARFRNWKTGYAAEVVATRSEDAWTIKELSAALQTLAENKDLGIRMCFFIDGLDEYEGDHFELCRMLKSMQSSSSIKMCVSSRPWNVFAQAFGADEARTIHMHELTRNDIANFAKHHLENYFASETLCLSASDIHELGQYLTKTANGVFLWVFLATKSLRDGVLDGDTVDDLWRRVRALPAELEPFFQRILEGVGQAHQRYMAEVFQMMLFTPDELKYAWIFLAYSLAQHQLVQSESDIRNCFSIGWKQMQRQFNARFGGLVIFTHFYLSMDETVRITFIHRSVRDFLLSKPAQRYLSDRSPSFHPHLGLLKSMFCFIRQVLVKRISYWGACEEVFSTLHIVARKAMEEDSSETIKVMDACADIVLEPAFRNNANAHRILDSALSRMGPALAAVHDTEPLSKEAALLRNLSLKRIYINVGNYKDAKVATDESFFDGYENSNLCRLIDIGLSHRQIDVELPRCFSGLSEDFVQCLDYGCGPMEELFIYERQQDLTAWHKLLAADKCYHDDRSNDFDTRSYIMMFLKYGASRTCKLEYATLPYPPEGVVCLQRCLPLRHVLSRHHSWVWPSGQETLDTIEAFLDTTVEENIIQLTDAMYYADEAQYRPDDVNDILRDTLIFERVLVSAMQTKLPLASFGPVVRNTRLLASMAPETVARLKSHIASLESATAAEERTEPDK